MFIPRIPRTPALTAWAATPDVESTTSPLVAKPPKLKSADPAAASRGPVAVAIST